MSRSSTLILLGLLVALAPFSGLPSSFRTLIAVVLGLIVLGVGVAERARNVREAKAAREHVETAPHLVGSSAASHSVEYSAASHESALV
jgi:hypothetical protein